MRRSGVWLSVFVLTVSLVRCNAVLGNRGASYAPPDATAEDATVDATVDVSEPSNGDAPSNDAGDSGCAGNLTCDPFNCGAQMHNCLGAACTGGLCVPTVLANNEPSASSVVVDDQYVFWTNTGTAQLGYTDGSVHRADKADGTNSIAVAVGQPGADTIAIDATNVYWVDWNTNLSFTATKDGTLTRQLLPFAGGLAPDLSANVVYVAVWGADAGVGVVAKDGGAYVPWVSAQFDPTAIVEDAVNHRLFWTDFGDPTTGSGGSIDIAPFDGPSGVRLADATGPSGLAYDGIRLYWANSQPPDGGSIGALTLEGGVPVTLASGLAGSGALATDGTYVYFAATDTIWRMKTDGSQRIPLAVGQENPSSLALDSAYVYWTNLGSTDNQDGTVVKVAK
jgi:membrane-bound inhibitor of C-type lysozyme